MTVFGYFLSAEEHPPNRLVEVGQLAERAGFEELWISDHYHPWTHEQGESAFVWSVLGALAHTTSLPVTTAVTCPTVRIHPAVVAQAAATTAAMMPGRFSLGVGSGENLNEHILGDPWPATDVRLEMLEEAVEVMRDLWTGDNVRHYGEHYTVENAKLFTLPDEPPPVLVSGFGPKATKLAARIGDGFCSTSPDAEMVRLFDSRGGKGKPKHAGTKVCWGTDRDACVELAHRLWPNEGLPGELAQELPSPHHFEQAGQLVTKEIIADSVVCGDDVDAHVAGLQEYVDAGFTHVFVQQIGPDQEGFLRFYEREVLPRVRG